jgi:hypothetical protein
MSSTQSQITTFLFVHQRANPLVDLCIIFCPVKQIFPVPTNTFSWAVACMPFPALHCILVPHPPLKLPNSRSTPAHRDLYWSPMIIQLVAIFIFPNMFCPCGLSGESLGSVEMWHIKLIKGSNPVNEEIISVDPNCHGVASAELVGWRQR